ncbi:hypothetical protein [Streptomyces sp. NPDC002855]|uniref:hypothetical protein n=1 Tax=Streptomyces sp. NPDC002855 TaxID=3154437 RepID=UPI0033211B78
MSTAFAENAASRRVSQKFGYEPGGVRRLAVDHRLVEAHDDVLAADRWHRRPQQPIKVEGFDQCRSMSAVPAPPPPVDLVLHV